ncbi:MAG TPA: hypothetical protein EYP46_03275 [Hadesarchaea archaeon]|nr:hypothetical protein [Hadesarchaea archaeon]
MAFSFHVLDCGKVLETDQFGNIMSYISYRNFGFLSGLGLTGGKIPILGVWSVGIAGKLVVIRTQAPGDGWGAAVDLSLLIQNQKATTAFLPNMLSRWGGGLVIKNIFSSPLTYQNGTKEKWPLKTVIGGMLEFFGRVTLLVDLVLGNEVRVGVEWVPVHALSIRGGIRYAGVIIPSLGFGLQTGQYTIDYGIVLHPQLPIQYRLSFSLNI